MMRIKLNGSAALILCCFAFVFALPKLAAQTSPRYFSYQVFDFPVSQQKVCFDSLRYLPFGMIVRVGDNVLLPEKDYWLDSLNTCMVLDSGFIGSTVQLYVRVYKPRLLSNTLFHKNPGLIEPKVVKNPFSYAASSADNQSSPYSFAESGLNVQGNLSRGLGVGNNQDVILNSDLNVQITGKIGNDIDFVAAISDQNNPIQPEGNTQQIQDFDQVYFSFSKDSSVLTVGDFLMQSTHNDYFKKFYKKSRGLQFLRKDSLFGGVNYATLEMAVSRGKFARNELQGEEGNQGPYRLVGSNGEVFIMIISGTEAVYLDGKLLERGQQNDYVIDYNTGEITFMPKVLINQYSRIILEFQYADRNYARSVVHAANVFEKGKFRLRGGFFSEQDNRNQPFQQSLDLVDSFSGRSAIDVMRESGDDPFLAVIPNVTRFNTFQNDRVMYRMVDTIGIAIYLYTDDPSSDTSFYQVTFTRVGQGNGNYVQLVNLANGRVFQWVSPQNGVPQGDYEPVVKLITPERLQMFTAGIDFMPDDKTVISVELAASNKDKNLFSPIDNQDNRGIGANLKFKRKDEKTVLGKKLSWTNALNLEWADENFAFVERYRDVEFERSWSRQYRNPSTQREAAQEQILNYQTNLVLQERLSLQYKLAQYKRGELFEGVQDGLGMQFTYKGLTLIQNASRLKTNLTAFDQFAQPVLNQNQAYEISGSVSQKIGSETAVGIDYITEQSLFENDTTNNLLATSFKYNQIGFSASHQIKESLVAKLTVNRRTDYLPVFAELSPSFISNNASLSLEKEGKKLKDRLLFTLSYRGMDWLDSNQNQDLPQRTILSRVEYQVNLFKKTVQSTTYYQIGTGREQRREFTYIEVPAGRGTHTWIDYNENGIQEINEFEPALFNDQARFIKVMIPTNEFIRSNTNEFNQSLRVNTPIQWQSAKGIKKLASRFSAVTSFRGDRRMTDNNLLTVLNPFETAIADTSLISLNSLLKSTVFFNRSNPKFGLEYNHQQNGQKQFLIQGFDSREVIKDAVSIRFNFNATWSLITKAEIGKRSFVSDFAPNRNFVFDFVEFNPELFWQPGKSFRIGGFYSFYNAENLPVFGGEKALWNEVGTEFRTFLKNLTTIDGKLSIIQIDYNGQSFSPVTYDMLKGFQNGRNMNWTLLIGGRIGKNIQITINYEGRNSENAPIVHIGRAEARYLF
jgi:hypothetical protein